jgi:hypothetical protein
MRKHLLSCRPSAISCRPQIQHLLAWTTRKPRIRTKLPRHAHNGSLLSSSVWSSRWTWDRLGFIESCLRVYHNFCHNTTLVLNSEAYMHLHFIMTDGRLMSEKSCNKYHVCMECMLKSSSRCSSDGTRQENKLVKVLTCLRICVVNISHSTSLS